LSENSPVFGTLKLARSAAANTASVAVRGINTASMIATRMSADVSGQKQTFALQNVMSALPPKAEVDFKCERRFRKQALSDASQSAADTLPNRSQAVLPPTHIWVRGASMFDRKQTLRRLNPQAERPLLVDASTRPSRRLCRRVAS